MLRSPLLLYLLRLPPLPLRHGGALPSTTAASAAIMVGEEWRVLVWVAKGGNVSWRTLQRCEISRQLIFWPFSSRTALAFSLLVYGVDEAAALVCLSHRKCGGGLYVALYGPILAEKLSSVPAFVPRNVFVSPPPGEGGANMVYFQLRR